MQFDKYCGALSRRHWWTIRADLSPFLLDLDLDVEVLSGCGPTQSPPCCTKCNSPPIDGQCTNFILLLLDSKWLNWRAITDRSLRQTNLQTAPL